MTTWTSDELDKIGRAEELQIASVRRDGTLRKPVTIWVVRHGDDLYVRSGYGRAAAWFRGTQLRHEGHIKAGGSLFESEVASPSLWRARCLKTHAGQAPPLIVSEFLAFTRARKG